MNFIELSRKQAKDIAHAILADIDAYIESHREEYEAYLKNIEKSGE